MAVELSSNCECPNCLGCSQGESDWNSPLVKREDDASLSGSSKKSSLSPIMKRFLSQSCSNGLKNNNKEDPVLLPSEEESSVGFSQRQNLSETSKKIKRKIKPSRELTIQEVLKKFGARGKFLSYSRSLGHSKDHVVVAFRRALYYSGIWVKHVQGSKLENHFSAKYFKRNPGSLHRLIPWLKRELTAVYGDYGYTVKNILAAILHHMTKFDLESESFTDLLEPYLLQHTRHFLHEFLSFVYSSYDVETYDRSAIYQCPLSTWVKNKSFFSTPVLSLPDDLSLVISQQGTKQSRNTQVQWNKTGKGPLSDLKQFPNGNLAVQIPPTSMTHQKTASKFHAWTKDEWEHDFKDVVCTTNLLLDWDHLRESVPGTDVQEKKTENSKLLPDHVEDLQKSGIASHAWRAAVDSNQVPPRKHNVKETNVLSPGQQVHYRKKEIKKKKKKLEGSSPKAFQRLSRERTQTNSKSREADLSMHCISGNVPFPTRKDKMPVSLTKQKRKCSQSSQSVEVGSRHSIRTQIPSSSRTPISKSRCVGPRKQSISRDQSNLSLRGSYKSKCFTQNIHGGPSKGNLHDCRIASLTPVHPDKICLTAGRRQSYTSLGNCDSQTVGEYGSLAGPQTEKYVSPSRQQQKGKNLLGRARKIGTLGPPKSKCQCEGSQTAAEFCV